MKFASLMTMIAVAARHAMPAIAAGRSLSATPKNPSPAGKVGRTVACDRRRAKKRVNVLRNRKAHRN